MILLKVEYRLTNGPAMYTNFCVGSGGKAKSVVGNCQNTSVFPIMRHLIPTLKFNQSRSQYPTKTQASFAASSSWSG